MQPLILGPALQQPADTDAAPADAVHGTSRRRPAAGTARAPRHDRRDALRSLAAELSAAAATIDELEPSAVDILRLPDGPPVSLALLPDLDQDEPAAAVAIDGDEDSSFADLRLAAIADMPAVEPEATPAPAPVDAVQLTGHADPAPAADAYTAALMERYRSESEVLAARIDAETAARAAAERRLAEQRDELVFLRNELQMVGQKRRKSHGGGRRLFGIFGRKRRAVVPANNPKKPV